MAGDRGPLLTSGVGERSKPWKVPPPAFPLPKFSADSPGGCVSNTDFLGCPPLPIPHWAAGTFQGQLEASPSRASRVECCGRPACCRCRTPTLPTPYENQSGTSSFSCSSANREILPRGRKDKEGVWWEGGDSLSWLDVTMNRMHTSAPGFSVIKLGADGLSWPHFVLSVYLPGSLSVVLPQSHERWCLWPGCLAS